MNVLVVGCGRLGSSLAKRLDAMGHDVAVIDADADSFHALGEDFDGITVTGVPMDMEVLRNAGVESCDAVLTVTSDDNLNITVSQIVRTFFGVENVVARISDPQREDVFHRFGLKTVCQNNLASDAMLAALVSPWESKQITFGQASVTFSAHKAERGDVGCNVTMLPQIPGKAVLGVVRAGGDMELFKEGHRLVLEEGDTVIYAEVSD